MKSILRANIIIDVLFCVISYVNQSDFSRCTNRWWDDACCLVRCVLRLCADMVHRNTWLAPKLQIRIIKGDAILYSILYPNPGVISALLSGQDVYPIVWINWWPLPL